MLILGDAILAAKAFAGAPIVWTTFGDQVPNSLFFSVDPVAMDCAMHDLIITEPDTAIPTGANNYLSLADKAGLGVFESVNPWSDSYRLINLQMSSDALSHEQVLKLFIPIMSGRPLRTSLVFNPVW